MVTIENDAVLEDFIRFQQKFPQPRHIRPEDGRVTYFSQGDFGPLRGSRLLPKLADFNLAFPGLEKGFAHLSPIQSHCFRAPEVFLGCPWSYSVDIWNLGLLVSSACLSRGVPPTCTVDKLIRLTRCGISWRTLPYLTDQPVRPESTTRTST